MLSAAERQQVVLDHAARRVGHGLRGLDEVGRSARTAESFQVNRVCGDEVHVVALLAGPSLSLRWDGLGCTVSQASASMLAELLHTSGPGVDDALRLVSGFREALRSRGAPPLDESVFGDAAALAGVVEHPARITCALLPWVALEDAVRHLGRVG